MNLIHAKLENGKTVVLNMDLATSITFQEGTAKIYFAGVPVFSTFDGELAQLIQAYVLSKSYDIGLLSEKAHLIIKDKE